MDNAYLVADGEGGVLGFTAARALRYRGCYVSYADVSGGGVRYTVLLKTFVLPDATKRQPFTRKRNERKLLYCICPLRTGWLVRREVAEMSSIIVGNPVQSAPTQRPFSVVRSRAGTDGGLASPCALKLHPPGLPRALRAYETPPGFPHPSPICFRRPFPMGYVNEIHTMLNALGGRSLPVAGQIFSDTRCRGFSLPRWASARPAAESRELVERSLETASRAGLRLEELREFDLGAAVEAVGAARTPGGPVILRG